MPLLSIPCPSCSAQIPASSRFCNSCGSAVSSLSQMPTYAPVAAAAPALASPVGRISSDSIPVGGFAPGVVLAERVYDIAEYEGQHFLSMEYIDGEDLASLIKRIGYLSNEKALEIARQLAAGLSAAHERGVLHRDLKPANIMIDGHGRVRITDFGLAIGLGPEDDVAQEAEILGTPAYMAPEQFAGKGASVRSDIYRSVSSFMRSIPASERSRPKRWLKYARRRTPTRQHLRRSFEPGSIRWWNVLSCVASKEIRAHGRRP